MTSDRSNPEKDRMLLQSLKDFFSDPIHSSILKRTLDPKRSEHISLRLIDWICTTYSKHHRLLFARSNGTGIIDIHASYKSHLRSFGKNRFDVFRRGQKLEISISPGEPPIETTIAQLNFFRWLITHDVLVYLEENKEKILDIQKTTQKQHDDNDPPSKEKKKKKGFHMSRLQTRVVFD